MQVAFKDPGTWAYLFIFPLIFIFFFGGGLTALVGDEEETAETARISLPVVNEDGGGELATTFLANLAAAGTVEINMIDRETADSRLDTREISHALFIPEGFSADFAAGTPVELRLVNHPFADINETEALRLAVDGVAQDLALEQQLVASLEQFGQMQAAAAPEQQAFSTERIVTQAQSQFERADGRPLVAISQVEPGTLTAGEQEPQFTGIQVAVPGFAVLFAFLAAQATAQNVYEEKKYGSFRRLLAAPISKTSLLLGKMALNFLMAVLQLVVIFAVALFIFPLLGLDKLSLGYDPLALVLLCLLVAVCSTSLGVLIAALAKTENQIGGLSSLIIWGMGILGGSLVPLFLMSDALNALGKIVPQYWAVNGFYELLVLSGGLSDIVLPLAALLGFSVLFFGVGVWRFDYQ
jgi:ABC-2 type transport system permease protein